MTHAPAGDTFPAVLNASCWSSPLICASHGGVGGVGWADKPKLSNYNTTPIFLALNNNKNSYNCQKKVFFFVPENERQLQTTPSHSVNGFEEKWSRCVFPSKQTGSTGRKVGGVMPPRECHSTKRNYSSRRRNRCGPSPE